jgi:hypothetical protein
VHVEQIATPVPARASSGVRPAWRTVAVPSEHGGWGLTLEPALLGLLVAWSWAGLAIGLAAMLAFLVRTPLKLALVDRRRRRSLARTQLAWTVAIVEFLVIGILGALAIVATNWTWLVPIAFALPLFAVELWFDVRSRGRRLTPELCGAIGITSVAAAIVLAGGEAGTLAVAASLVLAGRALASVPFVRTQLARFRGHAVSRRSTTGFQILGVALAGVAALLDNLVLAGVAAVAVVAIVQAAWLHRPVPPAMVLGLWQMALGLAVVAATAGGVHILA